MISLFRWRFLVVSVAFLGIALGEVVFRCPSCTAEQQAACPELTVSCAEIVREPGCGCCPVCARQEGEFCGVYTPRCSSGLRCYPKPDSDLPLEQLVKGLGRCGHKVDIDPSGGEISGELLPQPEEDLTEIPSLRKPGKDVAWFGHKESAVRQHRKDIETKMRVNKAEESKTPRLMPSQCQQELDQVLERISKMPFSDSRGPLEDLYALHIPNCDKKGQYNPKQCKMSVRGQRGECWCVSPLTGRLLPSSPTVRGDPNCSQYLDVLETQPYAIPIN
ncbi:insulin-like growth factor-binding protein 2-A [Megalops cyprinoides]|uniref:insulin-like growth factor-binding protein 2-A n=1 Tax=Megalops cyprinoides TaxID=118141 RepID=UPI001864559D|nr:insulin-like growth factor-binding protein 2-A [Megalops cyprinoides]